MIDNTVVVYNPRMGGEVVRYHTWPTIKQQNVGNHTFHVLRIYHAIFGDIPPEVTAYLIYHDVPEVKVGDPPHPIKAHNPLLKQEFDRLEHETLSQMVGETMADHIDGSVTDGERVKMKCADLLEMGEFALVERAMGNLFADAIIVNVVRGLQHCCEVLDVNDRNAVMGHLVQEMQRYQYPLVREFFHV